MKTSAMTFAACCDAIGMLAGPGATWMVELQYWNGGHITWKAYRSTPWVADDCHVCAPTPELLVERVRAAVESTAPATMRPEEVVLETEPAPPPSEVAA